MTLVVEVDREKNVGTMYSDKDSSGHSSSRVVSGDNTNVKDEDAFVPATSWLGTVEERRLVRKLDMRIMPLTCILYLFACKFYYSVFRSTDVANHLYPLAPQSLIAQI